MIGEVTRYMLPHLPGFPSLHVNRPINFSYNCYAYYLLVPLFFPHCAQILLENALFCRHNARLKNSLFCFHPVHNID